MKILEITKKNKKTSHKLLLGSKPIIMLFYWNQCGHCTSFKPMWQSIANKLDSKSGIAICQVEYENQDGLPNSIKRVDGFPTIVAVREGYIVETYNGLRIVENIQHFMKKYMSPIALAYKEKH